MPVLQPAHGGDAESARSQSRVAASCWAIADSEQSNSRVSAVRSRHEAVTKLSLSHRGVIADSMLSRHGVDALRCHGKVIVGFLQSDSGVIGVIGVSKQTDHRITKGSQQGFFVAIAKASRGCSGALRPQKPWAQTAPEGAPPAGRRAGDCTGGWRRGTASTDASEACTILETFEPHTPE